MEGECKRVVRFQLNGWDCQYWKQFIVLYQYYKLVSKICCYAAIDAKLGYTSEGNCSLFILEALVKGAKQHVLKDYFFFLN